jgi:hypothetical protein
MTKRPWLYVVAGPNGAGKSTLAGLLLPDVAVVNPDNIARALNPATPESAAFAARWNRRGPHGSPPRYPLRRSEWICGVEPDEKTARSPFRFSSPFPLWLCVKPAVQTSRFFT